MVPAPKADKPTPWPRAPPPPPPHPPCACSCMVWPGRCFLTAFFFGTEESLSGSAQDNCSTAVSYLATAPQGQDMQPRNRRTAAEMHVWFPFANMEEVRATEGTERCFLVTFYAPLPPPALCSASCSTMGHRPTAVSDRPIFFPLNEGRPEGRGCPRHCQPESPSETLTHGWSGQDTGPRLEIPHRPSDMRQQWRPRMSLSVRTPQGQAVQPRTRRTASSRDAGLVSLRNRGTSTCCTRKEKRFRPTYPKPHKDHCWWIGKPKTFSKIRPRGCVPLAVPIGLSPILGGGGEFRRWASDGAFWLISTVPSPPLPTLPVVRRPVRRSKLVCVRSGPEQSAEATEMQGPNPCPRPLVWSVIEHVSHVMIRRLRSRGQSLTTHPFRPH